MSSNDSVGLKFSIMRIMIDDRWSSRGNVLYDLISIYLDLFRITWFSQNNHDFVYYSPLKIRQFQGKGMLYLHIGKHRL